MRVWDVLFNEGAKVLFHVALAIFKVHYYAILLIEEAMQKSMAMRLVYNRFDVVADERRRNIKCEPNRRSHSYSTKNHPSFV